MVIDEQKKAQIILSDEVAELSESQIEDLRGSAGSLVSLLSADPPPLKMVSSLLKSMLKVLRPLTGSEIRMLADDGNDGSTKLNS